jgi:hypothetical protein
MKLTKGKISKLYNKKKQSLKKKNNKRKTSTKNKSFRKKRNIHLARKSLKNLRYTKHGGEGDEPIPKVEGAQVTPGAVQDEGSVVPVDGAKDVPVDGAKDVPVDGAKDGAEDVPGEERRGAEPVVKDEGLAVQVPGALQDEGLSVPELVSGDVPPGAADGTLPPDEVPGAVPDELPDVPELVSGDVPPGAADGTLPPDEVPGAVPDELPDVPELVSGDVPPGAVPDEVPDVTDKKLDVPGAVPDEVPGAVPDTEKQSIIAEEVAADAVETDGTEAIDLKAKKDNTVEENNMDQDKIMDQVNPVTKLDNPNDTINDKSIEPSNDTINDKSIEPSNDTINDKSIASDTSNDTLNDKSIDPSNNTLNDKSIASETSIASDTSIGTPELTPDKTELIKSLTNVVDYIADIVADKVSRNVTAYQCGDKLQNGFDSVNAAAETMALSTGGKRKKTRKFKLTNKTKTRKNV